MSRKTRISKRRIKTLQSELRMLQQIQDDLCSLLVDYRKEFYDDMERIKSLIDITESLPEKQSPEPFPIEDGDVLSIDPNAKEQSWKKTKDGWERLSEEKEETVNEKKSEKSNAPEWAKKLYKKIAIIAHPDKTMNDYRHEKLKKIFLESVSAMDEGKFKKLIGYALELDIPTESLGEELLPLLQQRVDSVKEEINNTHQSWEWVWGESMGILGLRSQIAHSYLHSQKIDVNIDSLKAIIAKIEDEYDKREDS